MLGTLIFGFIAGFFVGNGLPYYITGSFAKEHRSLLGKSAVTNVIGGVALIAIGVICWYFVPIQAHPFGAYSSALIGLLSVGLIHAKDWRKMDDKIGAS